MTKTLVCAAVAAWAACAQQPFPIGSYELPGDEPGLRAMARAGFNLVRCHSRQDLDRAAAAGLRGWMPLPLQVGTEGGKLRQIVEAVKDHPALAVWEGPDEVVWNFTAYSGLFANGTYPSRDGGRHRGPLGIPRLLSACPSATGR